MIISVPAKLSWTSVAKSREVSKQRDWIYNDRIALKFDRHIGSTAADVPAKFQSD